MIKFLGDHRYTFLKLIFDIGSIISAIIIIFNISWGINYYRLPLHQKLNIRTDYTKKDLEEKIDFLIDDLNEIHSSISSNDSLPLKLETRKRYSLKKILKNIMNFSRQKYLLVPKENIRFGVHLYHIWGFQVILILLHWKDKSILKPLI